jgi:hypothetical protein
MLPITVTMTVIIESSFFLLEASSISAPKQGNDILQSQYRVPLIVIDQTACVAPGNKVNSNVPSPLSFEDYGRK